MRPHLRRFLPSLVCGGAWGGAPAKALADATLLVTGLRPATPDSTGLAAMLSSVLEVELARVDGLELLPLDQVGPLYDYDVHLYLETCPRGEHLGCALVISQHAGADFAVTGLLEVGEGDVQVSLSLLDVGESREAVGLSLVVPPGEDAALLEQVASLLGRLLRGEVGQQQDIRFADDPEAEEAERLARQELEAEIEALVGSTRGGAQVHELSTGLDLSLPGFTPSDLENMRQEEGLSEWERLGMSEADYLRYRNSGLDLQSWRELNRGRIIQLLIRPRVGLVWGPVDSSYEARFAQDPDQGLEVVEIYAWQALRSALGGGYAIDLGFGISPALELEAGVGRVHGSYSALVQQETVGDVVIPAAPVDKGNATLLASAGLRLVPFPARELRPILGGGVVFWQGTAVKQHLDLSQLSVELPTFAAPVLVGGRGVAGLELGLGPEADLVVQVPLMLLVGDARSVHDEAASYLSDKQEPPVFIPLAAGLELGLQLRLGGGSAQRRSSRHGLVEDEDELDLLD